MKTLCLILPLLKSYCYIDDYSFYIFHAQYSALGGHPNYLFSLDNNSYPDTWHHRDGRCPLSNQTPCYLYNFNNALKAIGYVTDFSDDNCHIDEYILIFFIFTAGLASLKIREMPWSSKYEDIYNHGSL